MILTNTWLRCIFKPQYADFAALVLNQKISFAAHKFFIALRYNKFKDKGEGACLKVSAKSKMKHF